MPYNIIIGRDEKDKIAFGNKGLIFLGRQYVQMGQTTSLSNNILLDIARAHVILISGKRGSGKSYTIGSISESMANLPRDISQNLAVLIFDTMGIFWSMKYPNYKERDNLKDWGLKAKGLDVDIYVPKGKFEEYKKKAIPIDYGFSIKISELSSLDWCNVFGVNPTDPIGILIDKVISRLKGDCGFEEIINEVKKDTKSEQKIKDALENRFLAAKEWGLFDKQGTLIKDIIKPGEVSILDLSIYESWNIKCLVVGLISKKLLQERIIIRKSEELKSIEEEKYIFSSEKKIRDMPLVWLMIDEAHEFLPKNRKTPATDPLVKVLREGRQPGISMILATQQPGKIHDDVITQSDIVISHRITAKVDIEALNNIMQTYLTTDILDYLNNLPRVKGAAIVLDDTSERIYPMKVKPKMSWHGGEAPSAVRIKKKLFEI